MDTVWQRVKYKAAGKKRIIWLSIGLGVLYWILESAVEAFIFHEGSLTSRIFTPGMHEIWMRSLTSCVIIFTNYTVFSIIRHKKIEADLLLFRSLINQSNDAIFVIHPETGRFLDINDKACENLRYTRKELLTMGTADIQVILPDSFSWRKHIEEVKREGFMILESRYKRKDGTIFPVEINVKFTNVEEKDYMVAIVRDITERKQAEDEFNKVNALLESINSAQSQFILEADAADIFDALLKNILSLTRSEYGFIGEVIFTAEGKPYLKTHAITNIAWNEESMSFYKKYAPNMEFYNLKTLFGEVMTTGKPVISNNPSTDPRRGGLPQGHPPLNSFLGVPFYHGNKLVGMVGIANRPSSYDEEIIEYLQPLLNTCGNMIEGYRNIQKRKQAELAIMESENRYRMVVENIDEIIYRVLFKEDPLEGIVEFVSSKIEKIIGYQPDDFLISPDLWFKILHPDDRSSVAQVTQQMIKNKETVTRYYRLHHKITSEYLWMEDRVVPMIDDNNNVIGCFGVARDITKRKLLEERLEKSENKLRTIIETEPECVKLISADGTLLEMNPAGLHMIEADSIEQVRGNNIYRLIDLEFRKQFKQMNEDVFEGKSRNLEFKITGLKGTHRWLETHAVPFRNANGEIIAMLSVTRDITERKKMEEEIFQVQHDWEDTFDIITDMITVHDKDLNIIHYNKAAEKILGLPFLKVTKDKCFQFYHGTEYPPVGCPSCQTFKTGVLSTVEIFEPHLNMFIEIRAIPRFDSQHQIIGLIHVARDVTERKKLEDQLRHAQKMEAIGTLTGGIANDFNNILTAIIGYASLLRMKMNKDDPLRVNLDQILASSERAANLIQSLLAFSRKQISHLEPMNICENIKNIEKLLMRVIGENITLKTILAGGLTVMADSTQMDQVLINLCTNARDAMPDGGTLIIKTEPVELDREFIASHGYGEQGKHALISVTDTGIGMDEKTRERIFEPFFTTKEVGKGTGLGLAIVYGIIKQHKGVITCYSEPDKGTTFKIYLPMIKSELREIKEIEIPDLTIATETVLLAEDEVEIRGLTKQILEGAGYNVIEAVDGEDAVNKFIKTKDKIDILLFDIIMPKMNGKEAYDRIKKIQPDIKILLTSGYPADFIKKDEIYETGMNFVSKPISPTALLKKVREVLNS